MSIPNSRPRRQQGGALVAAVAVLAISGAAAAGIAALAGSSAESSGELLHSERAFYAAQSGFQRLADNPSLTEKEKHTIQDGLSFEIQKEACQGGDGDLIRGWVGDRDALQAEHTLCGVFQERGWQDGKVGISQLFLPKNQVVDYWTGGEKTEKGWNKKGGVWKNENGNSNGLLFRSSGAVTWEGGGGKGHIHRPNGQVSGIEDIIEDWEEAYGEQKAGYKANGSLLDKPPQILYIIVDREQGGTAESVKLGPGSSGGSDENDNGMGQNFTAEEVGNLGRYQVFRFDFTDDDNVFWEHNPDDDNATGEGNSGGGGGPGFNFDGGGGAVQLEVTPAGDSATVSHGFFDTNEHNLYEAFKASAWRWVYETESEE